MIKNHLNLKQLLLNFFDELRRFVSKKSLKKTTKHLSAVFFCFSIFLSACSTESKGLDSSISKSAIARLPGVSVMRLGDNITVIIPSQKLFVDYSVEISDSGADILQQVAELLMPMNKVAITIAAYAASPTQSEKDLFLTEKQAQAVSNYLWAHKIDARMMYAIGYGGGHPMDYQSPSAWNELASENANYRVEITLKDYVS